MYLGGTSKKGFRFFAPVLQLYFDSSSSFLKNWTLNPAEKSAPIYTRKVRLKRKQCKAPLPCFRFAHSDALVSRMRKAGFTLSSSLLSFAPTPLTELNLVVGIL